MQPLRPRQAPRWVLLLVVLIGPAVLVIAGYLDRRAETAKRDAFILTVSVDPDGRTMRVVLAGCKARIVSSDVAETEREVRIFARIKGGTKEDCIGPSFIATLDMPLAQREVLNGSTRERVRIGPL